MSDDMRCTQCGRTTDSGQAYGYACPQGVNCGPFEPIGNIRVRAGTVIAVDPKDARNIIAITTSGRPLDRAEELTEALKDAVYRFGEGLPIATVIGCLEIAKIEILQDHQE